MYDVFLSYSHKELARARNLYDELKGRGIRVWMDDPGFDADTSELGIPAGARHQDVIRAAIRNSGALLIADGLDWRDSEYCQDELSYARSLGRRALAVDGSQPLPNPHRADVVGPEDSLDWIVAVVRQGTNYAQAQVRIDALNLATPKLSRAGRYSPTRLITRVPGSSEAMTLIAHPELSTLTTPEQADLSGRLVMSEHRRKKSVRRASSVWLAVLLTASVVAGISAAAARTSQANAESSLAHAESLRLAHRSLAEAQSGPALASARDSVAAQSNDASQEALTVATARYERLPTWPVPRGTPYRALVFSPDDRHLLALTDGSLLLLRDGRVVRNLALGAVGSDPILTWGSPGHAWLLGKGSLRRVILSEDNLTIVDHDVPGASALVGSSDGSAYVGLDDGQVQLITASGTIQPVLHLPYRVTGLALVNSSLYVTTLDLGVHHYDVSDGQTREVWTTDLLNEQIRLDRRVDYGVGASSVRSEPIQFGRALQQLAQAGPARSPTSRDLITVCDDRISIVFGSGGVDATRTLLSLDGTSDGLIKRSAYISSVACWKGELRGTGSNHSKVWSDGEGTAPIVANWTDRREFSTLAVSNDGARLALISSAGELRIAGEEVPMIRELGMIRTVIPVTDDVMLLQDIEGGLHLADPAGVRSLETHHDVLWSLSQGGVTVVFEGSTVSQATASGLREVFASEDPPELAALSEDGVYLGLATSASESVTIVKIEDGSTHVVPWRPTLDEGERVADIALEGDRLYGVTNLGSIWAVSHRTGTVEAEGLVPVTGRIQLTARPGNESGVVIHSMQGLLHLLDRDLTLLTSRRTHSAGSLSSSQNGGFVVFSSFQRLVFDGTSLSLLDTIDFDGWETEATVTPLPSGTGVWLWRPALGRQPGVVEPTTGFSAEVSGGEGGLQDIDSSAVAPAALVAFTVCGVCGTTAPG